MLGINVGCNSPTCRSEERNMLLCLAALLSLALFGQSAAKPLRLQLIKKPNGSLRFWLCSNGRSLTFSPNNNPKQCQLLIRSGGLFIESDRRPLLVTASNTVRIGSADDQPTKLCRLEIPKEGRVKLRRVEDGCSQSLSFRDTSGEYTMHTWINSSNVEYLPACYTVCCKKLPARTRWFARSFALSFALSFCSHLKAQVARAESSCKIVALAFLCHAAFMVILR